MGNRINEGHMNPDSENVVETERLRIERLGRQRPDKFPSIWKEICFIYAVVMSQALTEYFVSGFNVVLPTIVEELNIPRASATWPTAAFPLVVASFLLPFGRLADMYGGYPVYIAGTAWLLIWSIIAGFAQNELMMDFCRALQGLGPAAYLPSSLMLLGSIYRPGPRKNVIFSLYGAAAPLGFFAGIFFAGLSAELIGSWNAYFWIGAGITVTVALAAWLAVPSDMQERRAMGVKMDWLGTILISAGLILVVFAITDSAHAPKGWGTWFIILTMILGVILLAISVYVEGWISEVPLLPPELFAVKYMKPLILALLFCWGSLGVFLLYATFYMTDIMGGTPMQLVAWYTPMALGGCIISVFGGYVLHIIPGTLIMVFAGVCWIISPLLFAIAPVGANYWYYTFWSMICATAAVDTTFTVSNIFITTSLPLRMQGLAGALINSIVQLGIAVFLGAADVLRGGTSHRGLRESYQIVFWFEVAMGAASLFILLGFVRLKKAESALTADEIESKAAAERAPVAVMAPASREVE